jgi:AcrR family transcriptional regulator
VEQAADAAGVSRATAYRYFPTHEALTVELEADALWEPMERDLFVRAGNDVVARIAALIDAVAVAVEGNERHIRTALRVYQDVWLRSDGGEVRRGRRREWIARALEPLTDRSQRERERLAAALVVVVGPDLFIMLKDTAGLMPTAAADVLKRQARLILSDAGLDEAAARTKTMAAAGTASAGARDSVSRRRG